MSIITPGAQLGAKQIGVMKAVRLALSTQARLINNCSMRFKQAWKQYGQFLLMDSFKQSDGSVSYTIVHSQAQMCT
jgi:hypothetical protein